MKYPAEQFNILAIDTATEACSVALLSRGTNYQRFAIIPRQQHHSSIFEMCRAVLSDAKIDLSELNGLVYGCGPGSFTGVRLAASLVQGLAYAQALPVVAISDLQAIATQALAQSEETQVLAAIDARMKEIYYGYFSKDGDAIKMQGNEGVSTVQELPVPNTFNGIGAGNAWPLYQDHLKKVLATRLKKWYAPVLPKAMTMLHLAMPQFSSNNTLSASDVLPVYLRHPIFKSLK